jgi:hypothetical protein
MGRRCVHGSARENVVVAEVAVDTREGIVTVSLTGALTASDLAQMQGAAAEVIRAQGTVRVLLVLSGQFGGWSQGESWDDLSFQMEFDPAVAKMAIVGEPRWKTAALTFTGKGLRPFPIEYFGPDSVEEARSWLKEAS